MANEELDTDQDTAVAEILLQLPRLILEQEFHSRLAFRWGSRRKRSGLPLENHDAPTNPPADASPAQAAAEAEEAKADAASPATPLSFSPSESDGHRKASKRKYHHKRKKEEWLRIIAELTERKELMQREIRNVSRYYDKLEAFNSKLKAKKEELINRRIFVPLPDLNAPVEIEGSFQMYTDLSAMANRNISRIMASEARRKRIRIYRDKNSNRLR